MDEADDLESMLDDTIVETARRRRAYPGRILPHVVHSLKAERKIMVGSTLSLFGSVHVRGCYSDPHVAFCEFIFL